MSAVVMDGTAMAREHQRRTRERAIAFADEHGRRPCLATVLVGDDPASRAYVRMKQKRCASNEIDSRNIEIAASATTPEAVAAVTALSSDRGVDGILVQHPAPPQVDEDAVFEAIAPSKDVDGVTRASLAAIAIGSPELVACTPGATLVLLDGYQVPLGGAEVVVVGRSRILRRPVGLLLLSRDASVTFTHSRTRDLAAHVGTADIVIAAVGVPELTRGSWVRPGAVVIDAGFETTRRANTPTGPPAGRSPLDQSQRSNGDTESTPAPDHRCAVRLPRP